MRVLNINRDNSYKPPHMGINRVVYKSDIICPGKEHLSIKHKNTSWMYRPNAWICERIYKCFSQAFRNVNKVNVYSYGCSLGYEAYSYVLWLLSGKKKNPEKFLPIMAKDYDADIINSAVNSPILIDDNEMCDIKAVVGENNINKFFQLGKYSDYVLFNELYSGTLAYPTGKLKDNVQFSVADIREDYKNIEPENSIVMASNLWPYFKKVDKGSYVTIGTFDNSIRWLDDKAVSQVLVDAGFKRTAISVLFRR